MKNKLLFAVVILMSGCTTNHQHDGLYIANKKVTGITKAWILEGDELTIYSMGAMEATRCDQFEDRIEIQGGEIFYFNSKGEIVISAGSGARTGYSMMKISDRTKYSFGELDKLLDESYETERRNRSLKEVK